jgi:hypothetical protein
MTVKPTLVTVDPVTTPNEATEPRDMLVRSVEAQQRA